ncbi:MipA/OmpV family protein [Duganella sp. FT92W]|uniref:MipA/OmpV family protein n=1 Tax=Pseudoduganella rivuli TaxID=2666085 RepID=A0A7X2LSF6_9BURK|nr:MipA/OmpV family protein [Pseudoduganella rivuli]MRV70877.1 MipA/OmpV family protein [Pseudoduganella rivuli]
MRESLFFLLAGAACCGAAPAWAQAPEPGLMPDGSYDMYAGLGVRSAPNYEGGGDRKQRLMPVLQVGWSNGAFISGMSAGWHWSSTPGFEYGPLLSVHAARSQHGSSVLDGAISVKADMGIAAGTSITGMAKASYRLRDIHARIEGGFFANYYLANRLRLTNSVLYGAGEARNGLRWTADLQRGAIELAPHHTLSLSAGATFGNRAYNTGYFGLRSEDVLAIMPVKLVTDAKSEPAPPVWAYAPSGGIKDIHAGARWNWALSPAWLLTTNVQVTQLRGGAKNSPLTDRATGVSVSTALAYRF